ncbi:intradiol ring-cleavage dioxygenase [Pseudoalteromonas sp. N1230-9]|uniref:dioxygenase family protein n=1 Tax=unclassified Pseudoalteromonas TaxID=194690 RepID=UPI001023A9D4|nr:intradiol ring-cleavage dioxygenase [Pseudoalteromonas sp. CO302Y]RZG07989.1 intradiol ring-cleavage dioxygenase [Pseudoalteromonas sp. CO133X]WOC27290.1 intradiol ring-cleavage dioxygenase [Pseudoalteromonas sp. N1230-9]
MMKLKPELYSRRKMLKTLGVSVAAVPMLAFLGCNSDGMGSVPTADSNTDTDTGSNDTSTPTNDSDYVAGTTALITEDFPDDSLFATASSCVVALTKATTEGPCYFQADSDEDISQGLTGLPMMLCLQLIDSDCNPLANHEISVWHCDTRGIYSADTSSSSDSGRFAGDFCTGGDQEAELSTWYRGSLITDSSGRVNFKTHFPGWYSGRTIHIHFKVTNNNMDSVISQFCFSDEFAKEICTTHSEYKSRGEQDTTLASNDNVFGRDYEQFIMNTAKNSDGTLLAYHTIQIS